MESIPNVRPSPVAPIGRAFRRWCFPRVAGWVLLSHLALLSQPATGEPTPSPSPPEVSSTIPSGPPMKLLSSERTRDWGGATIARAGGPPLALTVNRTSDDFSRADVSLSHLTASGAGRLAELKDVYASGASHVWGPSQLGPSAALTLGGAGGDSFNLIHPLDANASALRLRIVGNSPVGFFASGKIYTVQLGFNWQEFRHAGTDRAVLNRPPAGARECLFGRVNAALFGGGPEARFATQDLGVFSMDAADAAKATARDEAKPPARLDGLVEEITDHATANLDAALTGDGVLHVVVPAVCLGDDNHLAIHHLAFDTRAGKWVGGDEVVFRWPHFTSYARAMIGQPTGG